VSHGRTFFVGSGLLGHTDLASIRSDEYDPGELTMDSSLHPRIFGGEEAGQANLAEARVVVLPIPMECTVSYGKGTANGPEAILDASANMELFDEEAWRPYWKPGTVHTKLPVDLPAEPASAVEAISDAAREVVAAGKLLVGLGGEHTVTAGLVGAVAERYAEVGVLQIDAHADLRYEYDGSLFSHACVARRIIDDMRLPVVQCGIRSLSEEEASLVAQRGLSPFWAHERDKEGRWISDAVARLPEYVYVTIDVDGLDPSVMPATGTPEPGGLGYREVLALLRELKNQGKTIVGADIVEVAPIPYDRRTEFTAARLVAKLISLTEPV